MKIKKLGMFLASVVVMGVLLVGCKPYNKPEFQEISPSQTAFLIPLVGNSDSQAKLPSEESLKKSLVPTKRVQIPKEWVKTGRSFLGIIENGEYMPTAKLIVVERKPVTREWTEKENTGTSNKNEGVTAESKESIGFMTRMNCSAQINEEDAVKFLYRYNGKSLEDIMDTDIRAKVEAKFVSECSKRTLTEILLQKGAIMKAVEDEAIPFFKERGISITTLGMKGELTYLNAEIQKAIDENFKSAKALETQKNENDRVLSKAKADAEAVKIQASTINEQIRLKELENQAEWIKKWNGSTPMYYGTGESSILFQMPSSK